MERISLLTTDTTQPTKPVIIVDPKSITRNGFSVKWGASRDLDTVGGGLAPSPKPNFNIQKYILTRILLRDSTAKTTSLDRVDTVIQMDAERSKADSFTIAMRFLPPGTPFHLRLAAFDSSGYESVTDTLTVRTDSVRFAGTDSVLECPKGFIPVPRGKFQLGDNASSTLDEKPAKSVTIGSYCIEPYEHRDSTGKRFVSNVTFDQADAICKAMDPDPAFATQLCSEAEWERACEGPDSLALAHGIQSEGNNPSILQASCNQATNDSAMAMSFELRNAVCLTTEGVYDMAGNLSEWVRDPYVANAYAAQAKDTIGHEFAFTDSAGKTDTTGRNVRHGIRGGNYLKTNFPQQSLTQSLARCSNRDFVEQVRPVYRKDCMDESIQKIAVIYGPGTAGHRCIDIPDNLKSATITDLIPDPADSTYLRAFTAGALNSVPVKIQPEDTAFSKKKPISAVLTARSLAVVTFESSQGRPAIEDTLDAKEMRDTSQAGLERIFKREAGNPEWTVRKSGGAYQIKYLYAYTVFGTKPARPFYSSRVIGFRCCSLAKSRVALPDTALVAGH
ncbi:MAG: hypothetical protein JWP91_765 [Fibrobacteres bacterium]|nr:hypothetical protein [Fibrobacterota bacterium]